MIESLELPMWRGRSYTAYRPDPETAQNLTNNYIFVGDGWCVQADTKDIVMELAGYPEPWDTAVPQAWWDEHHHEFPLRGGWAVWHYPSGSLFGEPVFADDAMKRAQQTIASLIIEVLEKQHGRTTIYR